MENQKLTQRPEPATLSQDALIHVAEPFDISQGPDGSSYKFPVANLFVAGQDNIDIRKTIVITSTDTNAQILAKINALPPYVVNEKQSVWFVTTVRKLTTQLYTPQRILKFKMLNKGKGTYGWGQTQFSANDIELMCSYEEALPDIETHPATDIINYGAFESVSDNISQWLNNHSPEIVIQPQDDGYTLFQGTIDSVPTSYLWIGEPGVFGFGEQQSTDIDFQTLDDTIPQNENNVPFIRNIGLIEAVPIADGLRAKLNVLTTIITPIDSPVLFNCYAIGETGAGTAYTFLFLGGKGIWGSGGSIVLPGMLYPLLEKPVSTDDVDNNDDTLIIPLGEIEEDGFLDAVNAEEHDFTNTYKQHYFSYYIGDVLYLALFVGSPGIYGGNNINTDDFVVADFAQVTNGNISGVPTLQQVNADGNGTTDPLTVKSIPGLPKLSLRNDKFVFTDIEGNEFEYYTDPASNEPEKIIARMGDIDFRVALENGSIADGLTTPVVFETSSTMNFFSGGQGTFSAAQILINSYNPTFQGIAYNADYSLNYVDRSLVDKGFVLSITETKADLVSGKVPSSQLPEYITSLSVGQIVKYGKGFTIDINGNLIPNAGLLSDHEKGDFFRGISWAGKYIPYMRYKGTGDVNDFENHCYEMEINAFLPDEPGYIIPDAE